MSSATAVAQSHAASAWRGFASFGTRDALRHVSWTTSRGHLPFRDIFLLLLEASPKTFRSADSTSSILNCELQILSSVQDLLLNPTCGLLWAHVQNPHVDDILWKVQSHRRDQPLLIVRI